MGRIARSAILTGRDPHGYWKKRCTKYVHVHTVLSRLAATAPLSHAIDRLRNSPGYGPKPRPARVRTCANLNPRRHDRDQGSPGRAARPTRIFCRWKAAANWHRLAWKRMAPAYVPQPAKSSRGQLSQFACPECLLALHPRRNSPAKGAHRARPTGGRRRRPLRPASVASSSQM